MAVYSYNYHRPPDSYAAAQARREADSRRAADRLAREGRRLITNAIDDYGDRMSHEGRSMLEALAGMFKAIAGNTNK